MSHFVDVDLGFNQGKFTLEYSPKTLMVAPLHVAQAAIQQEEERWLLDFKKDDVLLQVGKIFVSTWGPEHTLSKFSGLGLKEGPDFNSDDLFCWVFGLMCPECDGAAYTTTAKGREIDCPCCGATGVTHNFSIFTNGDGDFKAFTPIPVTRPAMGDFFDYDFEALPIDEALEVAREA